MAEASDCRIGVDTGGTFTDLVMIDGSRRLVATHKVLSTPDDPARAVIEGIAQLLQRTPGLRGDAVAVTHGSTVATNALLEGTESPAAFVTTAGFEDTLTIARQDRPDLYALSPHRPPPPIPPERTLGLAERLDRDGEVIAPLTSQAAEAVVDRLEALGVEAVAISLLHSYADPAHEAQLAEAIRRRLGDRIHLTLSHELLREHREYERAATCVVNAVVAPRMSRYLRRLSRHLGGSRLRIMGSHGGTLPVEAAVREPVRMILSGPAGGALGAAAMARAAGIDRVITLDMGGTSTDVALIEGGPKLSTEGEAAGLPVRLPMIDIHTVGAGGGSVAWIDAGGSLRVGPRSAGADPGPACYGRQRGEPTATVTDAHVVVGHLGADGALGAGLLLDATAARRAVNAVAERGGLTLEQAAAGILRVADATMARAVQRVSLHRGRDPRAYALLAFGGAGGLHACRLAESLGMSRVLVPAHPGVLSAIGMLTASPRYTFSQAVLVRIDHGEAGYPSPMRVPQVEQAATALRRRADAALAADAVPAHERVDELSVDLRYVGQSYEINLPLGDDTTGDFEREHQRLYGYVARGRAIEVVAVRWRCGGTERPVVLPEVEPARAADARVVGVAGPRGRERWRSVDRSTLGEGAAIRPRTILREFSATTLVPGGWSGRVGAGGTILLGRGEADR